MTGDSALAGRRPHPSPGVLAVKVGDDLVLWDPQTRRSHILNRSAHEVWRRCDGRRDPNEIVDDLARFFAVDSSAIAADTEQLLRQFDEAGLIDRPAGAPTRQPVWPEASPPASRHDNCHERSTARHRWKATSATFTAFDFSFCIYDESDLTDRLMAGVLGSLASDAELAHRYTIRAANHDVWRLRLDGHHLRDGTPASLARYLVWHVNRLAVASVPDHVVVHAGGVRRDDQIVVLPASMNAGKSTLTASLVDDGWDYLSDEAVAIEPVTGSVRPYPRALTLDRGSWPVLPHLAPAPDRAELEEQLGSWHVPPDTIRPGSVAAAGAARAVVFPTFVPDSATSFETVPPAEGLARLLAHTFDFDGAGQAGLDRLAQMAATLPTFSLVYSRLDEARRCVESVLTAG